MRTPVLCLTTLFLGACAGSIEGVFEPACIAHEGDRIEMSDGRFAWHKFTDEIRVDSAGNRIDAFPGYPKTGRVESGKHSSLVFNADGGNSPPDHYLYEHRGRLYLLTYEQNEAVLNNEPMPACALRLEEAKKD